MKNKKVKIILSVFVAVIVVAAAVVGIKYTLYMSDTKKAINDKFGIEDCTDMVFFNKDEETELSFSQKRAVWDFMLNKLDKYDMTQEYLDNYVHTYGDRGYYFTFGDINFYKFEQLKIEDKYYNVYYVGKPTDDVKNLSLDRFFIAGMDDIDELTYTLIPKKVPDYVQ
ncbi:MAG: hypothetical protein ACI4II_00585 [Acutalibacteraceae bacterium]